MHLPFRLAPRRGSRNRCGSRGRGARLSFEALETRQLLYGTIVGVGDLGGGSSVAEGINDLGQVVGYSTVAGGVDHAFLFSSGVLADLGTLGGDSYAYGINDSGTVVGDYENASDRSVAFEDAGGVMTGLGSLQGASGSSYAKGVNASGEVVGYSSVGTQNDSSLAAFVYSDGTMTDLGGLAYDGQGVNEQSLGTAINDSGVVVGYAEARTMSEDAFIDAGSMTDLGLGGGSVAEGINDSGAVIVYAPGGSVIDAGGTLTNLPGQPTAINNVDDVVGYLAVDGRNDPDLYTSDGWTVDLYSLLPANSGWTLINAVSINDGDQVVGEGYYGGHYEGYILDAGSVVWNLDDSGPGSLRQAIEDVDQDPIANGADQITVAPYIQGQAIDLLSPLPALTRDQVTIVGPITLDGSSAGGDGLDIPGDRDGVQGLTIRGFAGTGISITGNQDSVTASQILDDGAGGIVLAGGASDDTIGGVATGEGNTIASNNGNGVTVGSDATDAAIGDAIEGNSIHDNIGLGIDLGDDGVTANDGSGHSGPNRFQNFPVITSALNPDGTTDIVGTLGGTPDATYSLEFFGNSAADPSGFGQGGTLVASAVVTANSAGVAGFDVRTSSLVVGTPISATATDAGGDTSEFSADLPDGATLPTKTDPAISLASSAGPSTYGQSITFTATVSPATTGLPTPTGSVQFEVDGADLGPAVTLVGGMAASVPISLLAAGSHAVTAAYSGDLDFFPAAMQVTQAVAKAPLTVVADAESKTYDGEAFAGFTAHITGFVLGQGPGVLGGSPGFVGPAVGAAAPAITRSCRRSAPSPPPITPSPRSPPAPSPSPRRP